MSSYKHNLSQHKNMKMTDYGTCILMELLVKKELGHVFGLSLQRMIQNFVLLFRFFNVQIMLLSM
jgi:hypothetical protein